MTTTSKLIRVCSFESRRAVEIAKLIEKQEAEATVAPTMQEVPLESQPAVFDFADKLAAGDIDVSVFMTGVGTDALYEALKDRWSEEELSEKIRSTFIAVRGPKPTAVLFRRGIKPDLKAPEPNTWQDLAAEFESSKFDFSGKCVAVQEYGIPNEDFYDWLRARGADPLPVSIYRWELPDDLEPMKSAIQATLEEQFDLLLWTSAQQVVHVCEVAERMGVKADWIQRANECVNASIGPTASERLREYGISPDLEPSHPKMAHLVREAVAFTRDRKTS